MNYKIRVESEVESKEAQELFFELGYENGVCSTGGYPALIIATPESRFQKTPYSSRATSLNHEAHSQYKEITIPELRDLVVLKRNSIDDATHTDGHYSFYVGKDKNYFFSSCDKAWRGTWKNVDILKPIEKPMKEYLDPENGYKLNVSDKPFFDWIEIPEGALFAYETGSTGLLFTRNKRDAYSEFLVWKRETLNDKVSSAETARQSEKVLKEILEGILPVPDFEAIDAFIESNVEQSSIVKTLAERQSTYGDFSKVAEMTQGLLFVMSQYGYSDMPDTHKESIHMIASKLARIVNGDNNHLDSWHDIGGYSKLIENLIEGK